MAHESLPKSRLKSQCICADEISRDFIFKWLFPTKAKNVLFYSLCHALSDSVINFVQVRYQTPTCFVIAQKYKDKELSSCHQWS